jgi:hypothetical protein
LSKALQGAAMLAGAVLDGAAMFLLASTGVGIAALPFMAHLMEALVVGGIAMEAGAIADTLLQNRAMGITTRQPAAFRQIIYGEQRVGGVMVYESTTGSHLDQYNMIIVLATHEIDSIVNLYLDGRQVHWNTSSTYNLTRNGVNFGGDAGGGSFTGPGGSRYNFDGLVHCEMRFGDQVNGDVMPGMTANDPVWATNTMGSPYLGGCAYVYLKIERDTAMFPQFPEIKFTVRGKNNIIDPRLIPVDFTIPGAVTSGTFLSGELVTQTGTGATAVVNGTVPGIGPMSVGIVTGAADGVGTWVGGTSHAIFTPTGVPVPVVIIPNVLQRPTTFLNGWAGNAHEGAYEEGVDQGYNWGLDPGTTRGYEIPDLAVDADLATSASVILRHTHTYAGCVWSFAALSGSPPAELWLNVNSMVNPYTFNGRSAGVWFSIDGGTSWAQIYNSPNHAQLWDAVSLSPTMDTSLLQVMAFTDAHDNMGHFVYDIQLADAPQINPGAGDGIFTTNWALIVADVIQDDQWGLGDIGSVNEDQLIAAANVCDEQVPLAFGGSEARWCCNWHYDTGTGPGDVLQTMMPAAAGRLSRIGGEWFIWPAYWQGPTFVFDESILTGPVKSVPFRKQRDLFNRVNGTYIAANFPYNVAGNLYDANGFYMGTDQNNFPFAFQPTNYPQYAQDALHGYGVDAFLEQDGVQLPREVVQNCVLSVAQAQRAAKVILLRNRAQASATLWMGLPAWQMQPLDVMLMTFADQGWANEQFEVASTRFSIESEADGPSVVKYQVGVQVTSASIYEWFTTDELSVYDVPANPQIGQGYVVPPPSGLTLASNSSTAVIGADGNVVPRILVSWVDAPDASVTSYNLQYQLVGAGSWISAPSPGATDTTAFISGVVAGLTYNVQIQSVRSNGATSVWVQGTVTVSAPSSTTNAYTNNPAIDLTNPTATTVVMGAVAVTFLGAPVNYSARTFTIPAPSVPTWYYITIADPTQQGESTPILVATCSVSNALVGVQGNTYIGAIQVIPGGGSVNALAGGWPAPTTFIVGS